MEKGVSFDYLTLFDNNVHKQNGVSKCQTSHLFTKRHSTIFILLLYLSHAIFPSVSLRPLLYPSLTFPSN